MKESLRKKCPLCNRQMRWLPGCCGNLPLWRCEECGTVVRWKDKEPDCDIYLKLK